MIKVLGNSLPKGFCQNISTLTDEEYEEALQIMQEEIGNVEMLTVSMTSSSILNAFKYDVLPRCLKYHSDIKNAFDPRIIWTHCKENIDPERPMIDFVIFNKSDKIAVATYSKAAPVIGFEDDFGNMALGVIFKPQFEKYLKFTTERILKYMEGNVKVTIPVCTHYDYPGFGKIPDYLKQFFSNYPQIKDIIIGADTEKTENLYGSKNVYNNAVIMY